MGAVGSKVGALQEGVVMGKDAVCAMGIIHQKRKIMSLADLGNGGDAALSAVVVDALCKNAEGGRGDGVFNGFGGNLTGQEGVRFDPVNVEVQEKADSEKM